MAKQSQLGTVNSILASTMALGIPVGLGGPSTFNETVNHSLGITDSAIGRKDAQSIDHSLTLNQTAVGAREISISISHALSLTDTGRQTYSESISSTLVITDLLSYFNYVDDRKPVGHTLNLTQTVTTLSGLAVSNTLNLVQTAVGKGPLHESINQWMALAQHTSTPYHAFITDNLVLVSTGYTPIYVVESITQNLILEQSIDPFGVANTLNLTQTVLVGKGHVVTQTLNITDEMEMTGLWIRNVEQDLGIGHAMTWLEDTKCARKQYTPFQGENTISSVTAPRETLQDPQGSTTDRLSLYQPVTGVHTSEVILRAPELDNRDRNSYTRVNTETRGGRLIVYADPNWPKVRTLAITITGLTESQVDDLHTFLQATIGQLIGLTDWEGNLWSGFITNPNEVATQEGKQNWTVTLEMEGEKLEVEQPGSDDGNGMALNLSQTVTAVIV